jgi:hypothetical protein
MENKQMLGKTIRFALLAGLPVVLVTATAQAQPNPCPPPPCTVVTKKVMVTEYTMEPYEGTRTTFKTEWQDQKYTAYKCEMVPEEHVRKVVYCKCVPVVKEVDVVRFECVPVVEEKDVTCFVVECVPVKKDVTRCVDAGGHYECKEVPCAPPANRHGLLHRLRHRDCGCETECCAPATTTVSVYVPKMVTVKDTVTVYERVCKPVVAKVKVTTFKTVPHPEKVKVTHYEVQTETKEEKFTICVPKTTPYEATRKVAVCTPVTEKVTLYRCVPHQVEKEVTCLVATPVCDSGCDTGCTHSCGHRRHRMGGLFHRDCR